MTPLTLRLRPALAVPAAAGLALRRVEFGDVLLLAYILVFARQFFWVVGDNRMAWALAAVAAALVWLRHLWTRRPESPPTPAPFWVVVVPPLLFFYCLRAALPDLSFDVLDFRLVNAERALRGWPIRAADFFPARFPFNPAPDMVMGLGRFVLGYRLGTAVNLGVLVWAGTVLEKLLRPYVAGATARSLAVLALLLTEQLLFQVNNYMVDMLALPLMLEAARLIVARDPEGAAPRPALTRIGLYLGASLAFKLTNMAFVAPLVLLCAYRVAFGDWRPHLKGALAGAAALALPLLPYTLFIYVKTGNPVFPLYNWLFKSPFWAVNDLHLERWGPVVDDVRFKHMRVWEVVLWPVLQPFRVEHTGGDLGPHWGRVSLGFAAALGGALWRGAEPRLRALCFVVLLGSLLWSATSGMLRYAAYVELLGGMAALCLALALWRRDARPGLAPRRAAAALVLCAMLAQSASSCVYAFRYEFGARPTVFQGLDSHLHEARYILRDRSFESFLSEGERARLAEVGGWVEAGPLTSGFQFLINGDAPQWCIYMPELFAGGEGRERVRRAVELEHGRGRKVYAVCLSDHLKSALKDIEAAGLRPGRVTPLSLPYFSDLQRFHASLLIEVMPAGAAAGGTGPSGPTPSP